MQKILFLDRDGVLVKEPDDYQLDSLDKLEFYPGIFQHLSRIVQETDFELVMVTNQDGLGTDSFPETDFWPPHNLLLKTLENEGITFREIVIDRTFAHENAPTRKPRTGLLTHYLEGDFDLANSFVVGDRLTDMELAKNLGCRGIWINNDPKLGAGELDGKAASLEDVIQLKTTSWREIYEFFKLPARKASVVRTTKETDIRIELNLDGTGRADNQTGIGFFDHMLDQLAKHSNSDLSVHVKGDLHIDEHHTIEDTALALGEAFRKALGDKMGIERYGYCLPMDDCLAQVAIDFGGRPWLVWEADFKREMIGQMPTEMFYHFFKSFSDTAACNLNVKAEGDNEHHKIEGIFKAWSRAIKMAKKRDPEHMRLPSTKGTL
ncbi:bifunctional histidinol-phosphatase/imidazoleglycerol-phosphate dehydratase HisB [Flavilitoribacter nigricans]|uniref:Histidine biosynthesis bifunctional protein HisB n=1 Tax=Flavilitoribacter nigricans (strain ATCC 23147 / DSM 23189 / NBRC 102662 / NCIMB 1420 / SS-2) TaxID=1122177 RepID=A0A2D0N3G6_FLAN2|nr:bifunctional histidinol-phosphatase/imidazoleglycerol-phosphate dehydratase HisB [Flavilitoribacter nigricans]PHN03082.1 bifunctional histidinol-phosphatase/imidazoleglycerol-phosphate dehydratase [Flavilitoribacter nigricans DSM 23189 = NBRC 102662]